MAYTIDNIISNNPARPVAYSSDIWYESVEQGNTPITVKDLLDDKISKNDLVFQISGGQLWYDTNGDWTDGGTVIGNIVGGHGINTATVVLYKSIMSTINENAGKPQETLYYNFNDGHLYKDENGTTRASVRDLAQWTETLPNNNGYTYVLTAHARSSNDFCGITAGDWQEPTLLVKDGEKGEEGISYQTIFYRSDSIVNEWNSSNRPDNTWTVNFSDSNSNWKLNPQGVDSLNLYEYYAIRKVKGDTVAGNWSEPKLWTNYSTGVTEDVITALNEAIDGKIKGTLNSDSFKININQIDLGKRFIDVSDNVNNSIITDTDNLYCLDPNDLSYFNISSENNVDTLDSQSYITHNYVHKSHEQYYPKYIATGETALDGTTATEWIGTGSLRTLNYVDFGEVDKTNLEDCYWMYKIVDSGCINNAGDSVMNTVFYDTNNTFESGTETRRGWKVSTYPTFTYDYEGTNSAFKQVWNNLSTGKHYCRLGYNIKYSFTPIYKYTSNDEPNTILEYGKIYFESSLKVVNKSDYGYSFNVGPNGFKWNFGGLNLLATSDAYVKIENGVTATGHGYIQLISGASTGYVQRNGLMLTENGLYLGTGELDVDYPNYTSYFYRLTTNPDTSAVLIDRSNCIEIKTTL